MAIEYVDSTQLDSDLTSVANAIRAKSGGSGQLAFPSGFVSEIGNIPSGGGTSRRYIIKDGKIQSGFSFVTDTSNMAVTEETGTEDYVQIYLNANAYGAVHIGSVDFTDYNCVVLVLRYVSSKYGSSYCTSSNISACPAFSIGSGSAPSGTNANGRRVYLAATKGNITNSAVFALRCDDYSSGGNIKFGLGGYGGHEYGDLFIKDLYLDSFAIC